jgi:putative heme transporter
VSGHRSADAPPAGATGSKRAPWVKVVSVAISVLLVVGIFVFAIPRIASYGEVLDTLRDLTWIELWSLLLATFFNLFTYWLANMAALPGLQLSRAAVITQTTTTVANTLPAGGAVAVGLTYEMLHSWGFTTNAATLYVLVTGFWNIFMKLGLPVLSVAILALTGQSSAVFLAAAVIGVVVLTIAVGVFAAILWKEHLAQRIGDLAGRLIAAVLKPFRRRAPSGMGERAVRFRRDTIGLIRRRWLWLTVTTAVSQLALFFVLLLSLRHVGVSEAEVSTAQLLAVFAFGRLLGTVPITPGGLGVIELGYIGGLVAAGGAQADVVAGVLLFRVLTFGIQIPIGGVTYLIWREKRSWRRPVPSRSVPDEELSEVRPLAP